MQVGKLFTAFKEMGNPYDEESAEILVLDKKLKTLPIQLIQDLLLLTHDSRGKNQFQSLIEGLKKEEKTSFY